MKIALQRTRSILSYSLISLILASLAACSERADLQSGLKDTEANEIVNVLNRQGIEASKRPTKEGVAIVVERADISRATDALQAAGLPRRNLSNLGQVFKKEGMISTPLEERVRYIYGLSEELQYTLQQFDNVISARVHVVLPERIAPGEPIQPSSAAVFIKYHPPFDEDTAMPRIRHLVASSIPGLSGEEGLAKVSVVLVPSEITAAPVEWKNIGPFSVQKQSANLLMAVLLGMALLTILSLISALFLAMKHDTKLRAWIMKKVKPNPSASAKKE
jgi:type III secretion protein J